jgi:pimeloyl-ACP methyl ester carboxylesterase
MATFLLVHGAWVGSLYWRPIAQALRKAGHEVYTPTLTGLGERKHLMSRQIDLRTHIQDVLGVLDEEDLSDLVLVGHSYGGMVVTGVADAVPDKIASLVYLDAFVPENGQALVGIVPTGPGVPQLAAVSGAEWLMAPPPVAAFGEPSEAVRAFAARKLSAHPTACLTQVLTLTGGIDRIRRKTYIYCNDPQPTTFTPFYEKVRNRPGWTVHTLPCTHMVTSDMPEELTALLQAAAPVL